MSSPHSDLLFSGSATVAVLARWPVSRRPQNLSEKVGQKNYEGQNAKKYVGIEMIMLDC
jgi:hypothetical protein